MLTFCLRTLSSLSLSIAIWIALATPKRYCQLVGLLLHIIPITAGSIEAVHMIIINTLANHIIVITFFMVKT